MKKILFLCSLAVFLLSAASALAAAALKPMASQRDVLKLFQTAMGNRYSDLNSNAKSGAQGVYDYIIGQSKITKDMINAAGNEVYLRNVMGQLDWFKAEFLKNTGSVLETKDRAGIQQAMTKRYSDICAAAEWNTAIKSLTKTYNAAAASAGKARKGVKAKKGAGTAAAPEFAATGEELCNFNYNRDLKDTVIIPARNNDYDNATKRLIALEQLSNAKNTCINETYTIFYAAKDAALNAFTAAKTLADTGPDAKYAACVGDRLSAWTWQ